MLQHHFELKYYVSLIYIPHIYSKRKHFVRLCEMASERVLSVRATRVLACAGLISSDELSSSDDNAIIIDILRNAKLHHLLGKSGSEKDLADVMQWMELSQTLTAGDLPKIEASLNMKSYLVGYTFTVADAAIYEAIRSKCASSVVNFAEMSRWYSHMQNICPSAGFDTMKFGSPASHFICLPTSNAAAPRAQKSSPLTQSDVKVESVVAVAASVVETAATLPVESASEVKKEKKEKKEKKTDAVAVDAKVSSDAAVADAGDELDPSKLDIRVGVVVKCWNHPDSDKCKSSILSTLTL
jgi:tRNA-binding EMAP/Myf-like protein